MLPIEQLPKGITLQKQAQEWQLQAHNYSSKHWFNLLFHIIGLGFVLSVEATLVVDFLEDWSYHSNSWWKVLLYVLQDCLFLWIVIEFMRSIIRLIQRQQKKLHLHLSPHHFTIATTSFSNSPKEATTYPKATLQDLYVNHGQHRAGAETKALLLNLPLELFICQQAQPPSAWGAFLREEQLLYMMDLLRGVYLEGERVIN